MNGWRGDRRDESRRPNNFPHVTCLPRLTGEVARRAGGGKPQSRYLQISDLESFEIAFVAFPLRPLRGHLPRKTGEV
jgi:hypothetical protein